MPTELENLSRGLSTLGEGRAAQRRARRRARRRGRDSVSLEEQAAELEALQQATGAPEIPQENPGVFRTLVDLLSRPNYAIAGIADEFINETPSVTRGVKRALTEIFSGVGGLQGQKRAFGEVLERAGASTTTLAEAFPALEGTWVGNFGSRGLAGIALDIVTDPLTYMSFGAAGAGRIVTSKGVRYLNAQGMEELGKITLRNAKATEAMNVLRATDDFSRLRQAEQLSLDSIRGLERKFNVGGDIDPALLEEGGIRLFGATIPGTEGLGSRFRSSVVAAANSIPGGQQVLKSADEFGDGIRRGVNQLFHPQNEIGNLPKELRPMAIKLKQNFMNAAAVHRGRLMSSARSLGVVYRKLEKADPDIGKRWYDIREGVRPLSDITDPEELEAFNGTMALYDSMRDTLVNHGILEPSQVREGYIFHTYKNTDDLRRYHAESNGRYAPKSVSEMFTKERAFDTYADSVRISREQAALAKNAMARGQNPLAYPELVPEYDVFENLARYVELHSDALARKAWREEATQRLGIAVDDFDSTVHYEISRPIFESRPRSEIVDEISALRALIQRSDAKPTTVLKRETDQLEFDVDTLTRRGVPLSAVDPESAFVHRALSREKEIDLLKKFIEDPDRVGRFDPLMSPADKKSFEAFLKSASPEEMKQFRRARAVAVRNARIRLGDLRGRRGRDAARAGRPLRKADIPAAKAKLRELQSELKSRATSDRVIIDNWFAGSKGFSGIRDEFVPPSKPGLKLGRDPKDEGLRRLGKSARATLNQLSSDGKREFIRQLISRAEHSTNLSGIEREILGEFEEFFPRRTVRTVGDGEIERTMEKLYGETGARYVHVQGAMTNHESVLLPKVIADDLNNIRSSLLNTADFKEFSKMIRLFDWFNNRFKLGVYTLWPASAVRDAYSNIALSMLDIGLGALNPKSHLDTVGIMAGRSGVLKSANGLSYSWDELRRLADELGVWVPGEIFAELTGSKDAAKFGTVLRKAVKARGAIENEARMQLWIQNIRRGADPRSAADKVREFLFNYGEVSQVEREVFRRFIPFYTFTRKNIELQWKQLRRNPGRQINQLKPFRGRDEENEQMVQWEAEALKLRMDRDGKTVHMLTGIDLPLRNLDTIWRGDFQRTGRSLMGMVTPIIKTFPEILLNQDTFLGRDLTRTQSGTVGRFLDTVPTPKPIKDWLGYKKEVDAAGRPKYTFDGKRFTLLFRSWMFSRAFSTSDRQFRDNMGKGGFEWQRMALDVLTGIRRKDINLDEQGQRRLRERIRQLEDSLARRGALGTFQKRFRPRNPGELE